MAILAIAILLLCLGSVSAVDEYKLNFTLETVNDNSQNENIVIDEIIENADDADEGDASVVSISKEKNGENLLKATNDDTLKSSEQGELRDKDTGSTDVVVPAGTSVTVQASMEYDYYWYLQMSRDGSSYSTVVTDTGHVAWYDMYTFTVESGTYYFKAVNYNGRYGSPSNILTYTVGAAVEETQTSISIDPTTVAPNNLITITPTVTKKGTTDAVTEGVVKFFYGGGTEIGEIDLSSQTSFEYTSGFADEGTYDIYAVYQANDKYGESTSDAVSVLVSQDTSKTPVTVTVALSKTGVAPGETITITPSVKNNNGEDVTGVVDLYYGNDNLIASGVAIGSSYSHAVSETSGEYQVYAKYLGNDDLAYAPGTSAKYVYKVKKQVQITLKASANEVTPSSYGSTRVTFEISCSETLPALKLYLNDEEFSTVSAGSTSASISFDSSDAGSNTVYVYLAEDEDFVEATSNTETVKVYTTVSVTPSITLNQSSVVEGEKLLVTVTASSNAPGTITIYSDSSYQNEIATLPVGESYEYTVPVTEGSSSYYTGYLYVYYNGYDDGYTRYTHYAYASGSKSCTVLRQNNAVLTGNGKTDDVEIDFGGSVILHIDLEYWKQSSQYDSSYNTVYVSNVVIYLDGEEFGSFEVNRESSGYYDYTYSIADYEITFGDAGDEGTHTIYAYYKGSNEYGAYYASATSNELNVNVKPGTVENNISIESKEVNYGTKANLTVTGTDGEYTVTVDKDYDVTVENGTGHVIIDVLAGNKTYDVTIVSKTNSSLTNTSTLTVNPISPALTISATNAAPTYGEAITISADKNTSAAGVVRFYEGDKEVNVVDVVLAGGVHTITAKYVADGNFTDESAEIEINVKEAVNELDLEITSPTYPENVTITLKAGVPGDYDVIIAGNPYTVTVADNGVGTKSIKLIPNEQYTATVSYEGNGNYSDNSATFTFKVSGNTIGLNATSSEKSIEIGQSIELNSSSKIAEATGKVTYSFDDGTENIIAEIGEIVTYTPKTAKEHTITVTYDDGIFDPETVTLNVVVNKKQNNVKVEVASVELPSKVIAYITADVAGTYRVYFDDNNYVDVDVKANEKTSTEEYALASGNYTTKVVFENENYTNNVANAEFEVSKVDSEFKLNLTATEFTVDDEVIIKFTLPSDASGKVTFRYANGTIAGEKEVGSGLLGAALGMNNLLATGTTEYEASLGKLPAGEYTIATEYSGDEIYNAASDSINLKVSETGDIVLRLRDATYTNNATITINSKDNVSITLQYYFTKPDEILVSPAIDGYINGVHLTGFGLYEFEKVVSGSYTTFGTLYNISESCELDIYVVFTSQQMSIFGNAYNVSSNHIRYVINIVGNETSELSVEADSVDDLTNATVVVKSNVAGDYIVNVNGTDYTVTIGDSGVGSTTIKVLSAGEYDVTVTAKDNASFTNSSKLVVRDSSVPVPDFLIVEAIGASYPANAGVVVKTNKAGDYVVTVNSKDYEVSVDGEATVTLDVLDADEYDVAVKAKDNASFSNSTKLTVAKGSNNIKVEASDVNLPENVTVKVTADFAGTYTIKLDGAHQVTVTVAADGGSASASVALSEGTYTPSIVGYADENYDDVVDADTFTVYPEDVSGIVLRIRDATYTNNATITINSKDNVSITLQYYFTKPTEILFSPEIDGYINGEHLTGFGLYEFEKVVSGSYATFGTLHNISESCELDIYLVFTSQSMLGSTSYNVNSNHIRYVINIVGNETSELSVEADSVDDLTNATVVVKSNVAGDYIVNVNGTDYTVTIGDSGVGSTTIKVLSAGEYDVTVTAKDNASFTNSSKLVVRDSSVPVPDFLIVEAIGASYPANAGVVVKTNKAGDYVVTVNGKDYEVSVDGEATVTLDVLDADEYDVVVKAKDNASFSNSTKLTVAKGSNNIKVEASDVNLPENVTVKVTADVAGTYTIKLDGAHEVTVTVAADGGSASASVALSEGTYTPGIVGYSDKNYDAVVDADTFTVYPEDVSGIVLRIRDATYTNNATITINSKDNVSITLQYYFTMPDEILISPAIDGYINGEHLSGFGLYEFEKVMNRTYATFGTLHNISESCELDIYVVFTSQQMSIFGNAYNVSSNHIRYVINIVGNETSELSVEAGSVDDLTNATVVVKSDLAGEYIVNVNGKDYPLYIGESGVNSTVINVLPAGNHTVTVSSKTNSSIRKETTLTVLKHEDDVNSNITIDVSDKSNVGVTVDIPGATGNVAVIVDGKETIVPLVDGKLDYHIDDLGAGNHSIVVVYLGDDAHDAEYASESFSIDEKPASSEVDITVPSDLKAGEDGTVGIKISNATGNVSVIIDGKETTVALDENGSANVPISNVGAGDHSVVVIYPGDETHAPTHSASTFNVPDDSVPVKEQSNATITTPVDFKVGDDANVTVDVPGATGNISVIVDGVEKVVPLVNGKAAVPIENISAGEHSVVVVYDGDDTHAPFHKTASFNAEVLESKFENLTANEKSIEGILVNSLGDIIPNAVIIYKVNGVEANVTTDKNGYFSFNVAYPATVEIAYAGETFILPTNITITLNDLAHQRQATSILGNDFTQYACDFYVRERGGDFRFQLVDGKGNPIANKSIYVGYNGVTLNRTTDENGFAWVQINLKNAGLYTFVVVFLGDDDYNASMAVHKITIKKKTTSISASAKSYKATVKTKKYTVTLKTIKGSSIDGKTYLAAGKKVTLKVNGKVYSAKTNNKGKVTFKITKLNKKGKYTAKISYAGDVTYKSTCKSVKLTIK